MSDSPQVYGDGTDSTIGTQLTTFYHQKKALIELVKERYFGQLADTIGMPKNMGKKIMRYHYLPLLDEANENDQGIDAAGALLLMTKWYVFVGGALVPDATIATNSAGFATEALAVAAMTDPAQAVTLGSGNLYGSSKDIGTIAGKMPALSEHGGRVNRVGMKRIELEGTITKYGFFDEYTQESLDFDTDAELEMHINREMLRGANEITEDALQIDLLNGAATIRYGGAAEGLDDMSGVTATLTEVTYADLAKLAIDLDNNRTPKHTKIISGSRMIDTKVINACRVLYIGSELQPTIEKMKDYHDNPAFIPLAQYAAAGTEINGEIGTVGSFRVVVVPEMMHHDGSAARSIGIAEGVNAGYRTTGGFYDAYPMLVVGSESFVTIGFQTAGKTVKFKIYHKKPGKDMVSSVDPYGESGLMSIKWYYGTMLLRSERLAVVWTVAQL